MNSNRSKVSLLSLVLMLAVVSTVVGQVGGSGQRAPQARTPQKAVPEAAARRTVNPEKAQQGEGHPPGAKEHDREDDFMSVILHDILEAVIAVCVFFAVSAVIKQVTRMLRHPVRNVLEAIPLVQDVIPPRKYTGEDGSCTLVIFPKKHELPLLNIIGSHESYLLRAEMTDRKSGVASGCLICDSYGNDAGTWKVFPAGSPNRRVLTIEIPRWISLKTVLIPND